MVQAHAAHEVCGAYGARERRTEQDEDRVDREHRGSRRRRGCARGPGSNSGKGDVARDIPVGKKRWEERGEEPG